MNLNQFNPFSLAARIKRPFTLDGATGSVLQQKGIKPDKYLWYSYLGLSNPDIIKDIHKEYIRAGADIITTNTFRTNPAALKSSNYSSKKLLTQKNVEIAKEAAGNLSILIAGSNAPAEDCYKIERLLSYKELENNHHKHINLLFDNGVHFILNETQSHFDEIKIICEYSFSHEIPYIISLFVQKDGTILSGEKLIEVIKLVSDYAPLAISINCIKPEILNEIYSIFPGHFNWGFYLNCGKGDFTDKQIKTGISANRYSEIVKNYLHKNPSFIGACCGSTPSHIKAIKKIIDETSGN